MMLEAAKQRVKMTQKILALNYLKGVKRRRLGTPLVEKAAKSLTECSERNESVVVKLMEIVVTSAERKAVLARKAALTGSWAAKKMLPQGWRRKGFRDIVKQEVEELWTGVFINRYNRRTLL